MMMTTSSKPANQSQVSNKTIPTTIPRKQVNTMSFDLAIWYPSKKLTNEEAGTLYAQLCEGIVDHVTPHEAINSFYSEITSLHPEIDDVPDDEIDNTDLCPWSVAFDRSPGHLIMSCVWSKAKYVEELVIKTALKYSLAVYNPQISQYISPSLNENS